MNNLNEKNLQYIESKQQEIKLEEMRHELERGNATSEESSLVFMEVLAEMHEAQQEEQLITADALATIYEAILGGE